MKEKYILIVFTLLIASCKPSENKESTAEDEYVTGHANPSNAPAAQLTEQQKAEGWRLLFDGTSMEGWRTFKNMQNNSWEVVDGTLHCKPFEQADKRADLVTKEQYDNFDLVFEWKIAPQSNSGVMFRVSEEYDQPYFTGPEYQLLDDGGYPGEVKPENFTGGNYDMHAPVNKTLNPIGEWNISRLVVDGDHVEHWLNGDKVVEYDINSDDWKKRKAASKWKDEKGYAVPAKGYIDLQDHSHEVWFRNIMIRSL